MPTAQELFKTTPLSTDNVIYTAIKLPARAIMAAAGVVADIGEPFAALIVDKDEVSLYIPADQFEDFAKRLPLAVQEGEFRLITLESVFAFDVIGIMAIVSDILRQAEVSLLPFGAFSRDHLLVPAAQFETAWSALEQAKEQL